MATKTGIKGNIHSAQHHDSAAKHVSGQAVYVDDINMPNHGLVVLISQSPHAHALIRGMDLTAVAAAPGVLRVMTAEMCPGLMIVAPWRMMTQFSLSRRFVCWSVGFCCCCRKHDRSSGCLVIGAY